jgi:hypothetical protein
LWLCVGEYMEKFILLSQAVSLSVIFYVVIYFLITWQWPETLLSFFACTLTLYFLVGERACANPARAFDPIAVIAPDHTAPQT